MSDDRMRRRMDGLDSLSRLRDIRRQQALGELQAAIKREEQSKQRCIAEEAAIAAVCLWKARNTTASGTFEVALYAEALAVEASAQVRSEHARETLTAAGRSLADSRGRYRDAASSRDAVQGRCADLSAEFSRAREIRDSEDATCLWLLGVEGA